MSPTEHPTRAAPRRWLGAAAAAAALLWASAAQALNEAHWEYRQPFAVEQAGLHKVALPLESSDRTQPDLRDLRLTGPSGEEVPYAVVRPFTAPARWETIPSYSVALKDEATVVTIDALSPKRWDAVEVVTSSPRFMKAVQIETSADGETWQTISRENPLFRQDGANRTVLPLPAEPARWVRLSLTDRREAAIVITGVRLREQAVADSAVEAADVKISKTEEFAGETLVVLALPAAHMDVERIELSVATDVFTRGVRAMEREYRDGEVALGLLAQDAIFRLNVEGIHREKTWVAVGATINGRELVLSIQNGDSPPLRVTSAQVRRRVPQLVFHAPKAGPYRLLSGNPQAAAPRYDLAGLVNDLRRAAPTRLDFRALERNPDYVQVDPLAGLDFGGAEIDAAQWRQHRGVELRGTGVHVLELDLAALSSAVPRLADVRLARAGKQVPYLLERTARLRMLELPVVLENDPKRPNISRWRVTLPVANAPLQQLILQTSTPVFERSVHILERRKYGNGETADAFVASGSWRRTPADDSGLLTVPINPPSGTELWVETDNGDNPPITLNQVKGAYAAVNLIFRTTEPGDVVLLTGNAHAQPPRYDLNLVAPVLLASEKKPAALADTKNVEAERRERPPIHSAVFWVALGAVVVVLLVVVAKLLPKPEEKQPPP